MSSRLGKHEKDKYVWAGVHNDGHTPNHDDGIIILEATSSSVITVKAGTKFYSYNEDTFTSVTTPDTLNNSYPNGTSIDYYNPDVVFISTDVEIDTTGYTTSTSYYIYFNTTDDTGVALKGQASFTLSTSGPVWSDEKEQWGVGNARCIGRYVGDGSSAYTQLAVFQGRSPVIGHIQHSGFTTDGLNVTIKGLSIDLDGKLVQYIQDITLSSNVSVSWKYIRVNENGTTPGYVSWATSGASIDYGVDWNPSGDRLDLQSIYDDDRKYCNFRTSTDLSARIIGLFTGTGALLNDIMQIDNYPKDNVNSDRTPFKENILLETNANNPTTVLAGTQFVFEDNYGNVTLIRETNNQVFAWGTGDMPAISNATFYLYYTGTSYLVNTTQPTWNDNKQGWYSATNYKALGRFKVTSSVVTQTAIFKGLSSVKGHSTYEFEKSSNSIYVQKPDLDLDGKHVEYLKPVILDFSAAGAGWFAIVADDGESGNPGRIIVNTLSTYVTISGNQLNMQSVYDYDKKYCNATGGRRILGVVYWTGSAFKYIIPIKGRPKSHIHLTDEASSTSLPHNATTRITYNTVLIDLNSEWNTSTSVFTPKIGGGYYHISQNAFATTVVGGSAGNGMACRITNASTGTVIGPESVFGYTGQTRNGCGVSAPMAVRDAETVTFNVWQNTGSTWSTYSAAGSGQYNWAKVMEV